MAQKSLAALLVISVCIFSHQTFVNTEHERICSRWENVLRTLTSLYDRFRFFEETSSLSSIENTLLTRAGSGLGAFFFSNLNSPFFSPFFPGGASALVLKLSFMSDLIRFWDSVSIFGLVVHSRKILHCANAVWTAPRVLFHHTHQRIQERTMATIIAQEIPGPDSKDYDSEDTYMFEGPRQLAGPIFEFRYPTSAPNDGKACIQQQERDNATNNRSSLLFGELAPMGVTKMFDQEHLRVRFRFRWGKIGFQKRLVPKPVLFIILSNRVYFQLAAGQICLVV